MTAPLKTIEGTGDIVEIMRDIGVRARAAARALALASPDRKDAALAAMARAVRDRTAQILAANAEDVAEARSQGATSAFLDRLTLDEKRLEAMAAGLDTVRGLADPVGTVLARWSWE